MVSRRRIVHSILSCFRSLTVGMSDHEFLQTKSLQVSRWLLYLQSQVQQVIFTLHFDTDKIIFFSSRFTVSDKYSDSFHGCFQLSDDDVRTGEICNACVLIVKRWKKLPASSTKNWAHVVDARYESLTVKIIRENTILFLYQVWSRK